MAEWKRDAALDEIELATRVPDAEAVTDGNGNLMGWDESAAIRYLRDHRRSPADLVSFQDRD